MSKEFSNNIESPASPERFGRNVNINAIFLRHGEKVIDLGMSHTGLTEAGLRMSSDFGARLEEKDAIKPYSSDTARTIDTVMAAVNASPTEKKLSLRITDELRSDYDEKGPFLSSAFVMKKEILGQDFKELPAEEQKRRLRAYYAKLQDRYLSYRDQRPDASTQSPLELAANLAKRVDIYIRMADRLKSGSRVDLLNATHDWDVLSFMNEMMLRQIDGREVRGFQSVEEIGGPIGYTENFNVDIATDGEGRKTVGLEFRGQKYPFDQKRLQELVETAERLDAERAMGS